MIYSPLNRLDSSPYSIWDSNKVNKEIQKITDSISTIASQLLNINTSQNINGQKSFSDIYFKNSTPTYKSIMSWIHHDITPIFGSGSVSFSRNNVLEEGAFSKPNVSGVIMSAALNNPIFSMNNLEVIVGTNPSNNADMLLTINAPNVPLAAYDPQQLNGKPSPGQNLIQPYYWGTSKGIQNGGTTISLSSWTSSTGTALFRDSSDTAQHTYVFLAYNKTTDITDILVSQEKAIQNIPSSYTFMAPICTFFGRIATNQSPKTNPFIFSNGQYMTTKFTLRPFTSLTNKSYFPKQTCISKVRLRKGVRIKSLGYHMIPEGNTAPSESLDVAEPENFYELYLPLFWDGISHQALEADAGPTTSTLASDDILFIENYNIGKFIV
jgi:hypothetical protein